MAFLDSSIGGASRSINFENVAEAQESAAANSSVAATGAEVLETLAREANGAVLWFCELATLAAVALVLAMVFEVSVWKQFVAATSATLFLTVAACLGAYVLMLRADGDRYRS
jgi:tellurite resistance protein TehA-like permease